MNERRALLPCLLAARGRQEGEEGGGQLAQSQPSRFARGDAPTGHGDEPCSPQRGLGRAAAQGAGSARAARAESLWVVLCRLWKRKYSLQVRCVPGFWRGLVEK